MYIIMAIITLIIILTEIYHILKHKPLDIRNKPLYIKNKKLDIKNKPLDNENFNEIKYNKYLVRGDKVIIHDPGYIYLKENFNFFINEKNKTLLAQKNKVYKINTKFTVEIVDVNGKDTIYYYIKSH